MNFLIIEQSYACNSTELGSTQERGSDAESEKRIRVSATVAVIYGGLENECMHAETCKEKSDPSPLAYTVLHGLRIGPESPVHGP